MLAVSPLGSATLLAPDNSYANIAADSQGNYVVTWTSQADGDGNAVLAKRFTANGDAIGNAFVVNTTTTGNQDHSSIAMNGLGQFVVTWQGPDAGDSSHTNVFAQEYDASGTAVGGEILVNSHLGDSQSEPSVAMNATGQCIVTWSSVGQDEPSPNTSIHGQRLDAAGGTIRR